MSDRYELFFAPPARRAIENTLPLKVVDAVWQFCDGPLRDNPHRVGTRLHRPFTGQWAAHRGNYRIRYKIDEDRHRVIVVDIAGRADVYDPGRA